MPSNAELHQSRSEHGHWEGDLLFLSTWRRRALISRASDMQPLKQCTVIKPVKSGHENNSPPLTYSRSMNKRFSSYSEDRRGNQRTSHHQSQSVRAERCWKNVMALLRLVQLAPTSKKSLECSIVTSAWKAPSRLTMKGCSIIDMICFSAFTCSTWTLEKKCHCQTRSLLFCDSRSLSRQAF